MLKIYRARGPGFLSSQSRDLERCADKHYFTQSVHKFLRESSCISNCQQLAQQKMVSRGVREQILRDVREICHTQTSDGFKLHRRYHLSVPFCVPLSSHYQALDESFWHLQKLSFEVLAAA